MCESAIHGSLAAGIIVATVFGLSMRPADDDPLIELPGVGYIRGTRKQFGQKVS